MEKTKLRRTMKLLAPRVLYFNWLVSLGISFVGLTYLKSGKLLDLKRPETIMLV